MTATCDPRVQPPPRVVKGRANKRLHLTAARWEDRRAAAGEAQRSPDRNSSDGVGGERMLSRSCFGCVEGGETSRPWRARG